MEVKLKLTVTDWEAGQRFNIYRRADGKWWVLNTTTDPNLADMDSVCDFIEDTFEDALRRVGIGS